MSRIPLTPEQKEKGLQDAERAVRKMEAVFNKFSLAIQNSTEKFALICDAIKRRN